MFLDTEDSEMEQPQQPKRGLSALLASTTKGQASELGRGGEAGLNAVTELPIAAIKPSLTQPRTHFDPETLSGLAASIKAQGLLQPIVVLRLGAAAAGERQEYEIVAGERRWRAAQVAGLAKVPAIVKASLTERDKLLLSLVENLQREDLNPLEEATAYDRLAKIFNLKHDDIADAIGKSRATVSNVIRLLELPSSVQDAVRQRCLSVGHAKILLTIPDARIQTQLAAKAQAEDLTVRDLERLVVGQQPVTRLPARAMRPKGSRATRMVAADIEAAEQRLREHFGTRVTIEDGVRKGKIIIEFYSGDDFSRIAKLMNMD